MRVAIYTRISTDEENQPYSLESQDVKLKAYIASQDGWELTRSFTDQASGAKTERPGLQQALQEAKAGRFDLLLVYRVDRFSRSVQGLAQLLEELSSVGVAFRSSTEPFDTTTAAGRMMVQMLGVFAEFERATIIDRVISGMERKAARGEWTAGARPYGYRVEPKTHHLEVVEDEAALIPVIFKMYIRKRMGAHAIAEWLTKNGHRTRTGRPWGDKAIITILRNRVYMGEILFRGQHHAAPHTPLVDQELFDQVQALLNERGEDRSKRAAESPDYLLSGLIVCAHCKKRFIGTAAQGKRYRYRYYTCYSKCRYGKHVCDADRLSTTDLESAILDSLTKTFERTNLLDEITSSFRLQAESARDQQKAELKSVRDQLRKSEEAIERYLVAFESGTLDGSVLSDRLKTIGETAVEQRQRRDDLEAALAASEVEEVTPEQLAKIRNQIASVIKNGDRETQKQLVKNLVYEVQVESRGNIVPIFRIPTAPDAENQGVRAPGGLVELRGKYSKQGWQLEKLRKILVMEPKGSNSSYILRHKKKQEQHHLCSAEVDELAEAYKAGEPVKELTARFNISRTALFDNMKRQGIARRYPRLAPDDVTEAARLYRDGQSLARVAEQFGVDAGTVHGALRKVGVRFRDTHGRER